MSEYYAPETIKALREDLGRLTENSLILAGGTDLVIQMNRRRLRPDAVLTLEELRRLKELRITGDRVVIGAMVTMTQLHDELDGIPELQALADAAGGVGSPQIRNKATVGGNVANASPAADTPPVLQLLGARIKCVGPGTRQRLLSVQKFYEAGENGKTQLRRNEVITEFIIDRRSLQGYYTVFEKLGHRSQVTISRIGIGLALKPGRDGVIEDARVLLGAIKPVPFELKEAERILIGKRPDPALARELGKTFIGNTRRKYKEGAAKGVFEDALLRFIALYGSRP